MSRRRGEFEHRTSIFEGAFRAWSHLGGLHPEDLENKPAADLDPLTRPIENDPRVSDVDKKGQKKEPVKNPDGTKRREYPYEPLPRSGLAHPYVQAILSPWLGPDADHDAIQLGLTTLRTWWQHRRKGESGSAMAALGTDKMRGVVEGYTRHFFNLAHCLVVNDKEQPPRTLHTKMKELEKQRSKHNKKRGRTDDAAKLAGLTMASGMPRFTDSAAAAHQAAVDITRELPADDKLSPLERLHMTQQMKLRETGGIRETGNVPGAAAAVGAGSNGDVSAATPIINMKGKCVPGKIDLPSVVTQVNHHASQLTHRGNTAGGPGNASGEYGDPTTTPVVFVSHNGDIQIAMSVDGITCAHCVKIVETVLKGCNGNKSPIEGLIDAAADRALCKVLVKLDKSSNAKRVAFEAARNLSMVGYTAKPLEMSIVDATGDKKAIMDLGKLSTAFEVVANTDPKDVFNWGIPCTCPDNGILRDDCSRHSQMNTRIFETFQARQQQVQSYMAGCGSKYGMPCSCGPGCKCEQCSGECRDAQGSGTNVAQGTNGVSDIAPEPVEFPAFYGQNPGSQPMNTVPEKQEARHSIISFDRSTMRHMSISSNTTFGRAMSGLSALSIDWENMDDFDVNVDHSAHINNDRVGPGAAAAAIAAAANAADGGTQSSLPSPSPMPAYTNPPGRRSSLRRSITAPGGSGDHGGGSNMQVSFQV